MIQIKRITSRMRPSQKTEFTRLHEQAGMTFEEAIALLEASPLPGSATRAASAR